MCNTNLNQRSLLLWFVTFRLRRAVKQQQQRTASQTSVKKKKRNQLPFQLHYTPFVKFHFTVFFFLLHACSSFVVYIFVARWRVGVQTKLLLTVTPTGPLGPLTVE
ncbi:hypothetical protein, unlikely [Trypanosoma brucei gambiense DAL972]|uniref:Uncharacterized protein n=1 Tax=Trypanosoma brucei gambiense (strain MHOM/CI/86/DAL972) TaxID=679716 RepID=D0A0K2_TRYB9|nr:hypothetical protein, unlikely [Trypanosoma brucei gambiense DAL972]CBH16760.1 hypothetical protein, unlikely [Trypanosoma brucei gambiense DAL972]|eukprot:XP_011779024.1 hypothetical protein, unlikely [Trypanosoma brucei gambiense DAL972]